MDVPNYVNLFGQVYDWMIKITFGFFFRFQRTSLLEILYHIMKYKEQR